MLQDGYSWEKNCVVTCDFQNTLLLLLFLVKAQIEELELEKHMFLTAILEGCSVN